MATYVLTSSQEKSCEFSDSIPKKLYLWIDEHTDNNDTATHKFHPGYFPQSVSLGPGGRYCFICEKECKFDFEGSLPALEKLLEAANNAKSTAGLVGLLPVHKLSTI